MVPSAHVETILNELLESEADQLCGAKRYERTADRIDTRAGSDNRKLPPRRTPESNPVPVNLMRLPTR